MTTTADIARTHGHTGPSVCHDCGTPLNLHFLVWAIPETGESGTSLECCNCGLAAGDSPADHAGCEPDDQEADGEDPDPIARVLRRDGGWVMPDFTDLHQCTSNHQRQQDGRPACTAIPVWKVVEDHGMHLTIGFYCDADLPEQHRTAAA